MLRIHFTADDLAKVRFVQLGPMAEAAIAASLMATNTYDVLHGCWRTAARQRMSDRARHMASWLFPRYQLPVDIVTLAGPTAGLDEAVENFLQVPEQQLLLELNLPHLRARKVPLWLRELARGDHETRREVTAGLVELHDAVVGDRGQRLQGFRAGRVALWAGVAAEQGIGAVLARLDPQISWEPPVLTVKSVAADRDVALEGRSLAIAPSAFCWPNPQVYTSTVEDWDMTLVVPAMRDTHQANGIWGRPYLPSRALAQLIGRKRAMILELIAQTPLSTKATAASLGISTASTSEHAAALREANLITTQRTGSSVLHTITPLGRMILESTR